MQDAMAEYKVKGVVGERQLKNAALPQLLVGEFPERQPGPDSLNGLSGKVHPRPEGSRTHQALRLRPLAQTDLEHPPAGHVQGIDACRQVALVLVAEAVVVREEPF